MRAVRAGGDRQDAHEVHSPPQRRRGARDEGRAAAQRPARAPRRRSRRSASPRRRPATRRWTRRASSAARREQVDEFLAEVVEPLLAGRRRGRARRSRRCAYDAASRTTALPLPLLRRGKVRDVYEVDAERLLLVATDRVSAFDVVMRETVPHKGAVLTQLTAWWLRQLGGRRAASHAHAPTPTRSSREVPALAAHRDAAARARDALPSRTEVFPVECVCAATSPARRGRSTARHGTLAGEPLPAGLRESDRLDPPRLQPGDEGRDRARREHHRRARWPRIVGDETATDARAADARSCTSAAARSPSRAGSSSPTPSSSSARRDGRDPARRRSADARQLALLARRRATRPVGRSRASTSSRCATTSTASGAPAAGTARRRLRRFRTRSSMRRARGTSTPSSASPARHST